MPGAPVEARRAARDRRAARSSGIAQELDGLGERLLRFVDAGDVGEGDGVGVARPMHVSHVRKALLAVDDQDRRAVTNDRSTSERQKRADGALARSRRAAGTSTSTPRSDEKRHDGVLRVRVGRLTAVAAPPFFSWSKMRSPSISALVIHPRAAASKSSVYPRCSLTREPGMTILLIDQAAPTRPTRAKRTTRARWRARLRGRESGCEGGLSVRRRVEHCPTVCHADPESPDFCRRSTSPDLEVDNLRVGSTVFFRKPFGSDARSLGDPCAPDMNFCKSWRDFEAEIRRLRECCREPNVGQRELPSPEANRCR